MSRKVDSSPVCRRKWKRGFASVTAVVVFVGVGIAMPAVTSQASTEVSLNEPFSGTSLTAPSKWNASRGGTTPACLTALSSSSAPIDLGDGDMPGCADPAIDGVGSGVLRLTAAQGAQSTTVLYNEAQELREGLDISFKLAMYGGTGADGISFFLKDGANVTDSAGASGGALGYSLSSASNAIVSPGINGGLLGIGFDRFGNFPTVNSSLECTGVSGNRGTGQAANSITVRGADLSPNRDGTCGYFQLGQQTSVDYSGVTRAAAAREVRIVIDSSISQSPKVSIYFGNVGALPATPTLVIDQPDELKAASSFKFGWSASTGGSTNIHEIWGLTINVPTPCAVIPFLAEGAAATVRETVITAVTNSATNPFGFTYLHQSLDKVETTFTFDPEITLLDVRTGNHADAALGFERYELTGRSTTGAVVFTASLENVDGTFSYRPGTGAQSITGPIATLEVLYKFDDGAAALARGSYIDFRINCEPRVSPASMTINGTIGTALPATGPLNARDFEGTVIYAVTSGTLPAGLTLDPNTGVISGTPTGSATSQVVVTITATGAAYGTAVTVVTFTIQSNTPPAPPVESTTTVPPTTAPPVTTPAPVPVGGALPSLRPGESQVLIDGVAETVEVFVDGSTDLVLRGQDFELRLAGDCTTDCTIQTTADGRQVLTLEERGRANVSGEGFLAGTPVYVWLFSEPTFLGELTVQADGTFAGAVSLEGVAPGEHTLQVNGTSFDGRPRTANLGVIVNPLPGALPSTGGDPLGLWVLSFSLVALGMILVVRRRPQVAL